MTTTNNLNLSLIQQNQAQKEVTVNEAIVAIDALLNIGAVSIGSNIPPSSPQDGEIYIIGESALNEWLGYNNQIAWFFGNWRFITPNEGVSLWVNNQDKFYYYDGTNWQDSINNISRLGINSVADSTNKLSVNSEAVLFNNQLDNIQIKINKDSSNDTASHVFQSNFLGYAEFGLIGDNNFQIKVSSDGSSFNQSFVIDKDSGNINFKQKSIFEDDVDFNGKVISDCILKNIAFKKETHNSSAIQNIDLSLGNFFEITLVNNCTINFINLPFSNDAFEFTLVLKQDFVGSNTVTFSNNIKHSNGTTPTFSTSSNSIDIIKFITTDGGINWFSQIIGLNMS